MIKILSVVFYINRQLFISKLIYVVIWSIIFKRRNIVIIVKRIAYIIVLLLLMHISTIEMQILDINDIRVKDDEISWIYRTKNSDNKSISLTIGIASNNINYHVVEDIEESNIIINSTINITFVFIGREVIYCYITYTIPNITIEIESNIMVDKNNLIIQWFTIETRIKEKTGYEDERFRYRTLAKEIRETIKRMSMDMIKSFIDAFIEGALLNQEVMESIEIVDVIIDLASYIEYLKEKKIIKEYNCNNLAEIPMYAWIEIEYMLNNKKEVNINIIGISNINILNALEKIRCITPLIKIFDMIIKNTEFNSYYKEVSSKIDIEDIIIKLYQNDINNIHKYINITKELVPEYALNPQIKIEYNINDTTLYLGISIVGITNKTLDKEDILCMLLKIVEQFIQPNSTTIMNWREILNKAQVIDERENFLKSHSSKNSLALKITIAVYVFVAIQTSIIVFVILNSIRSNKK